MDRLLSVLSYKYLGSIIDNRLNFNMNVEKMCRKGLQCIHCLQKLSHFHVDKTLVALFYKSYVESVLTFSLICWYGNTSIKARKTLSKTVKMCSKVMGVPVQLSYNLYSRQVVRKAHTILSDCAHPLHSEFWLLPSGSGFGKGKGTLLLVTYTVYSEM